MSVWYLVFMCQLLNKLYMCLFYNLKQRKKENYEIFKLKLINRINIIFYVLLGIDLVVLC